MVDEGRFRRDLYYRLSGIGFHIPPLRERQEDIVLLLKKFMTRSNLLPGNDEPPAEIVRQFIAHDWPGNVRELDNKVKRLEIMSQMAAEGDLSELSRALFDAPAGGPKIDESGNGIGLFERVEQFERKLITEALLVACGNKSEAARMLGVHEATVRTKIKRYGIAMVSIETGGNAPN